MFLLGDDVHLALCSHRFGDQLQAQHPSSDWRAHRGARQQVHWALTSLIAKPAFS